MTQQHGSYSVHGAIINVPPGFYVPINNIVRVGLNESWLIDFMVFGPADAGMLPGGPWILLYNSPNSSSPVYEPTLTPLSGSNPSWTMHQRLRIDYVYGTASKRTVVGSKVFFSTNDAIGTVKSYNSNVVVCNTGSPYNMLHNLHLYVHGASVNCDIYITATRLI